MLHTALQSVLAVVLATAGLNGLLTTDLPDRITVLGLDLCLSPAKSGTCQDLPNSASDDAQPALEPRTVRLLGATVCLGPVEDRHMCDVSIASQGGKAA